MPPARPCDLILMDPPYASGLAQAALDRRFPLMTMFEHPTIRRLAGHLSGARPDDDPIDDAFDRARSRALRRRAARRRA